MGIGLKEEGLVFGVDPTRTGIHLRVSVPVICREMRYNGVLEER